jgi:hypothetical protein
VDRISVVNQSIVKQEERAWRKVRLQIKEKEPEVICVDASLSLVMGGEEFVEDDARA